jgi:pentatricopeptide repeat protein
MNDEEDPNVTVKQEDDGAANFEYVGGGEKTNNPDFRPDHGSSFVPGAGPEHLAPKSLDHFKRGYEERAAQRDKEFYTVGGANNGDAPIKGRDSPALNASASAPPSSNVPPPSQAQSFSAAPTAHQKQSSQNQSMHDGVGYPRGNVDIGGRGGPNGYNHQNSGNDDYDRDCFDERGYDDDPYANDRDSVGRFGRGGNQDDFNPSSNGTGFGGRGGRGGIGNRRYMDDPWGYRDRPTVLQGLDINALMDRLADLSQGNNPDKLFAELDRVRSEYKQIFETGKAMTALISVAARRKQIGLGHAVWDWMDLAKLPKNTFHYNSMISVAEKAKNYQQALDLLNEMTKRSIPKNEVT